MALPTSGQITMDMIRAELGLPSQANFSLHTARTGGYKPLNTCSPYLPATSGPAKLSDWYGYSHNGNKPGGGVTYNGNTAYFGSVNMYIYKNGSLLAQRGPANGLYGSISIPISYVAGNTIRIVVSGTPAAGGSINTFAYTINGVETDCLSTLDTGTITIACGTSYSFYLNVAAAPAPGFHDVFISPIISFVGTTGSGDKYSVQFQASESLNVTVAVAWSWRSSGGGSFTGGDISHVLNSGGTTDSDYSEVLVSYGEIPEVRIDSLSPTNDGSTQQYVG